MQHVRHLPLAQILAGEANRRQREALKRRSADRRQGASCPARQVPGGVGRIEARQERTLPEEAGEQPGGGHGPPVPQP